MMTPVQEVELFIHKEKVRQEMDKRKCAMLESITLRYTTPTKSANASAPPKKKKSPPVIDIVSDSGDEEGPADTSSAAAAAAVSDSSDGAGGGKPPPTAEELQVPKTIRDEWQRIERLWRDGETGAPKCKCPSCPYSAGGPLTNRYHLIERLVELEHYLWGS